MVNFALLLNPSTTPDESPWDSNQFRRSCSCLRNILAIFCIGSIRERLARVEHWREPTRAPLESKNKPGAASVAPDFFRACRFVFCEMRKIQHADAELYQTFLPTDSAIRTKIEDKYAEEWRKSGLIKRWILRRRMEHEISKQEAQASKHISRASLF